MPDATDSQHPTSCNEDRKRSLEKRRDTVGQLTSKFQAYFFLGKFAQLFCLQRRHVGHTNFGTWGLANSIRFRFDAKAPGDTPQEAVARLYLALHANEEDTEE